MTEQAATLDRLDPAHAGQAVYSRSFLSVYDAFVGATILGRGVPISPLARAFISLSNARGILDNRDDGPAELDAALATVFPDRTVTIHGTVALFAAHRA